MHVSIQDQLRMHHTMKSSGISQDRWCHKARMDGTIMAMLLFFPLLLSVSLFLFSKNIFISYMISVEAPKQKGMIRVSLLFSRCCDNHATTCCFLSPLHFYGVPAVFSSFFLQSRIFAHEKPIYAANGLPWNLQVSSVIYFLQQSYYDGFLID